MDIHPASPNIPKAIFAKLHIDCLQLNGAILLEKTDFCVVPAMSARPLSARCPASRAQHRSSPCPQLWVLVDNPPLEATQVDLTKGRWDGAGMEPRDVTGIGLGRYMAGSMKPKPAELEEVAFEEV